jgi:hypothetical protein
MIKVLWYGNTQCSSNREWLQQRTHGFLTAKRYYLYKYRIAHFIYLCERMVMTEYSLVWTNGYDGIHAGDQLVAQPNNFSFDVLKFQTLDQQVGSCSCGICLPRSISSSCPYSCKKQCRTYRWTFGWDTKFARVGAILTHLSKLV